MTSVALVICWLVLFFTLWPSFTLLFWYAAGAAGAGFGWFIFLSFLAVLLAVAAPTVVMAKLSSLDKPNFTPPSFSSAGA